MAAWQYTVYIVPKKEVEEKYGVSCKVIEKEFLENYAGWQSYPQAKVTQLLSIGYGSPQTASYGPVLFGNDDSSCVMLITKGNVLEDITIRLDLRDEVKFQIETLLELCYLLDGVFVSPDLDVFECKKDALIDSIKESDALKFAKDPRGFLDSMNQKP